MSGGEIVLYAADRHQPLQGGTWDEAHARGAIAAIAADAEGRFDPAHLWPIHPLDHIEQANVPSYKSLYVGAAGVIWALDYLRRAGAATPGHDWAAEIPRVHHAYLDAPESVVVLPSYLVGEAGILLVWWRLQPSGEIAERLLTRIHENVTHPANEFMLGAPGSMLAALFMYEWTGEPRWRGAFRDGLGAVWQQWTFEPSQQCWLWTQLLFGQTAILVGAVHGAAGNLHPLLRAARWMSAARRAALYQRSAEILRRTAQEDADGANWPQSVVLHLAGRAAPLVQWCHGAPGMVGSFRHFPPGRDAAVDALLLRGGELIWRAGPLTKGPGLCHGTAGNGYAFLELYRRSGDERWLERARAFAMHAIGQSERMRAEYGQGRYSLWTGDAGLAIYLWHCIHAEGGFPSVEVL
jgi:hypothetical protein